MFELYARSSSSVPTPYKPWFVDDLRIRHLGNRQDEAERHSKPYAKSLQRRVLSKFEPMFPIPPFSGAQPIARCQTE